MDKQLEQYKFGNLSESGIVKGLNGKGYDVMLDLAEKMKAYNKDNETDLGLKAFAYLFRRLGPPKGGCEPQYIARYMIPTSNEKVVLCLNLGTEITAEVIAEKALAKSYLDWYFEPIKSWWDRCNAWAIENKQTVVYDQSFGMLPQEKQDEYAPFFDKDLKEWELSLPKERQDAFDKLRKAKQAVFNSQDQKDFFEWKALKSKEIRDEYKKIEGFPLPTGSFEVIHKWHTDIHSNSDNSSAIIIYTAVNDLIRELIKPVLIDGVYCNLFGSVDIVSDESTVKESQERIWKHSGNGFIEYDLKDYNDWVDICIIANKIGNGDIQLGFQKVFAKHKNAQKMKVSKKK